MHARSRGAEAWWKSFTTGKSAEHLGGVPVIQGKTSNTKRERLFGQFRTGELRVLVVSKVANFSIDLPEASVAIQISGTFGSRQEEAQRLGRVLRPKADGKQAHFYTVIARDTIDAEYAAHRQRFLAEQGYAYTIVDADDVLAGPLPIVGSDLDADLAADLSADLDPDD